MKYRQIWTQIRPYYLLSYVVYYSIMLLSTHFLWFFPGPRFILKQRSLLDFALNSDAIYFISNDYMWEHLFAFLPGYPTLLKVLRWLANTILTDDEMQKKALIVMGLLLNAVFVAFASINLYGIAQLVTNRKNLAKATAIAFFFCPGKSSFKILYSEAFYSFLVFWAIRLAYQKLPEWGQKISVPLQFLKINALSLSLFLIASTVRSTVFVFSPVYGIPILKLLYDEFIGGRRMNKIIGIITTGILTLLVFTSFLVLHNLFGYWQFCTIEPQSWFCNSTPFNIYGAIQEKFWNVRFRFFLNFFYQNGYDARVGLYNFFLAAVPFKLKHSSYDALGLLVSYIIFLFIIFSWGFLPSTHRFLSTHPLFLINMAVFLIPNSKQQDGIWASRGRLKRVLQFIMIMNLSQHLVESTINLGTGTDWF